MSISKTLAQVPTIEGIGRIEAPTNIPLLQTPGVTAGGELPGIVLLLNRFLMIIFLAAGFWALLNFIVAGFGFMSAGGDSKQIGKAWERIWQSMLGLMIVACSFLFAAIIGLLLFGNATIILKPTI